MRNDSARVRAALLLLLVSGCTTAHEEPSGAAMNVDAPAAAAAPAGDDLDRRIAAAFPGYRLTTEAEIGRRSGVGDPHADPARRWQPSNFTGEEGQWYGSGERWWVWTGDFDGDGREDTATILTQISDPVEDRFVVLHGDGTHADLGTVGSDGRAAIRSTDETGAVRDEIWWVVWDKEGGRYRWNPQARTYDHGGVLLND